MHELIQKEVQYLYVLLRGFIHSVNLAVPGCKGSFLHIIGRAFRSLATVSLI